MNLFKSLYSSVPSCNEIFFPSQEDTEDTEE